MQKSNPDVSVIKVLKQDERTLEGQFLKFEMYHLGDGPSNNQLFIAQEDAIIKKDQNNNFKVGQNFGSMNAFGVSALVLGMYDQDMAELKNNYEMTGRSKAFAKAFKAWQKRKPIGIYPYEKELQANAHYNRGEGSNDEIHFYSFEDNRGKLLHTSEMFDVIAHETGHAVLDRLRPDFLEVDRLQTKGLHESFGDLTAMLAILHIPRLRADFLAVTGGNLHKKSFMSTLAEEFNNRKGLRNAIHKIKINNVPCEEHDLSQVFTGAIYDILARGFDDFEAENLDLDKDSILTKVQKDLRILILRTFIEIPYSDPSFSDAGKKMEEIAAEDFSNLEYIYQHIAGAFKERGIDIHKKNTSQDACDIKPPHTATINNSSICGTLSHLWPSDRYKDEDFDSFEASDKTNKPKAKQIFSPQDWKDYFQNGKGI